MSWFFNRGSGCNYFLDQTFKIGLTGGPKITDASTRVSNIIVTDVQASNGVIHVIDKVLLPLD
ncbi:MAG: fasciclin domain-containing protein [Saprospirales bacterium]|nr:fasciclin domain-containing protein [Saprospirales bacterium]